MERFYLTFDEYFKMGAKAFFEAFGYKVTTEFELFKLPKKIDVLVIEAEAKAPPEDFALFTWFTNHNLISYKSPADPVREKDFRDALIYLNGYINLTDGADYSNTSMTILANHVPKKFLKAHAVNIEGPSAGVWKIHYGLFSIYFVDLNKTELKGVDQAFFRDFAETEAFKESLFRKNAESQKILDILHDYIYLRIDNFEGEEFKEFIMPATMRADVTRIAKPWFDKGKQEGRQEGRQEGKQEGKQEGLQEGAREGELQAKLATARNMLARKMEISLIKDLTGLTEHQLRENGIIG